MSLNFHPKYLEFLKPKELSQLNWNVISKTNYVSFEFLDKYQSYVNRYYISRNGNLSNRILQEFMYFLSPCCLIIHQSKIPSYLYDFFWKKISNYDGQNCHSCSEIL